MAYAKLDQTTPEVNDKTPTLASIVAPAAQENDKSGLEEEDSREVDAALPEEPIKQVNVDGLALLKIIRHARETHAVHQHGGSGGYGSQSQTVPAVGQLTGIDLFGQLEVSNSFPLPSSSLAAAAGLTDEDSSSSRASQTATLSYTEKMLEKFKEVNSENAVVGFYVSTTSGQELALPGFIESLIISQLTGQGLGSSVTPQGKSYQHILNKSRRGIALVYDVSSAALGYLDLRAYGLSKAFMDLVQSQSGFDTQSLLDHQLLPSGILEPIPVYVKKSVLLNAYLAKAVAPNKASPAPLNTLAPRPTQLDAVSGFGPLGLPINSAAMYGPQQAAVSQSGSSSTSSSNNSSASSSASLTTPVATLISALDNHANHLSTLSFQSRQLARDRARVESLPNVVRRREENAQRAKQGLELLPPTSEELALKEPSRLDTICALLAVNGAADALDNAAAASLLRGFGARTAFAPQQ